MPRPFRPMFVLCASLATSACPASAPPTAKSPTTDTTSTPTAAGAMQVVRDDGTVLLELRADGSFVTPSGEVVAKFDGHAITSSKSDKQLVIGDDGSIKPVPVLPGDPEIHLDANDDVVFDDGGKIHVAADGALSLTKNGAPSQELHARVVGMKPETHRRAAVLAMVSLIMGSEEHGPGPAAAPPEPPPVGGH